MLSFSRKSCRSPSVDEIMSHFPFAPRGLSKRPGRHAAAEGLSRRTRVARPGQSWRRSSEGAGVLCLAGRGNPLYGSQWWTRTLAIRPAVASSLTSTWSPRTLLRRSTATEFTPAKTSKEIEFQLRRGRQRLRKVGAQLTALAEPASVDPPFDPHRPARWRLWREVSLTHHRR